MILINCKAREPLPQDRTVPLYEPQVMTYCDDCLHHIPGEEGLDTAWGRVVEYGTIYGTAKTKS